MAEINIRLSADRISRKAGEKVRIVATFDKLAFASVNERREQAGYQNVMRTAEKVEGIDIEATVHEDTTDFIVLTDASCVPHLKENQNAVAAWYHVTVVGDEPKPEPEPTPVTVELGEYQYSVELLSDTHICKSNDSVTPTDTSDDWGDEKDFTRCMDLAVADPNVKCVMGCGDVAESQTNNDKKHPEATCDADYAEVKEMYDVPYWQTAGLRLFSPLGNHDFYGLFESRAGDTLLPDRFTNYNSISGRNPGVLTRIGKIWPTDGGINGIVPSRGRIVFDMEKGKHTAVGQADMNFLAYYGYVEKYKDAAGYTDKLVPEENRFSDKAMAAMTKYVNDHWDACRDKLTAWADGGCGMRNVYSKLSYWLKKDKDVFVHLSVDYGSDLWPVNDVWHDRMIHARTLIDLSVDDPFVRRLKEFVADTGYSEADEAYNYQYYSVNSLIWLKEIIENNTDKKIYVFTHHFMPNRVGNGVGRPKDGNWQYAEIHPADEKDAKEGGIYPVGSNALTGIQFWFFSKLMNLYQNVVWFSGHSHISMSSGANFDNHDYAVVSPSERNGFVYTKASLTPLRESAWTVALPSMSKPRNIVNGQSVRRYEDAEMAVMEIYERGVKIKGYKVRENNADVKILLAEQAIQLI